MWKLPLWDIWDCIAEAGLQYNCSMLSLAMSCMSAHQWHARMDMHPNLWPTSLTLTADERTCFRVSCMPSTHVCNGMLAV